MRGKLVRLRTCAMLAAARPGRVLSSEPGNGRDKTRLRIGEKNSKKE